MRIDYAAATDDGGKELDVQLSDGRTLTLKKLRLGGFIQMRAVEPQLLKALKSNDAKKVEECYERYIRVSTPEPISGRDMFRVYSNIMLLNQLDGTLPFMEAPTKETAENPVEYPNRAYAVIVHQLASRYHWSREEILNLWPEETMVYVQEIMNDDWHEKEWEWEMAGFGWYRDGANIPRRNPYPSPAWAAVKVEVKKVKLIKSMLPVGAIVDLGGFGLHGTGESSIGEQRLFSEGSDPA